MKRREGESYLEILRYWGPEMISGAIIFTLPILLDAFIVSRLQSTATFGAVGVSNGFLHLLTKLAESFSVATTTIVGKFNGAKDYKKAGSALGEAFWSTLFIGLIPCFILLFFAKDIFLLLGTPPQIAEIGAPYLKLRGIGILLTFVTFAFFGFMRGIKNTKTPMNILLVGVLVFILCDYPLVLGKFGFPQMNLQGSAIATIIQYSVMIALCIIHILRTKEYKIYFPETFFFLFNLKGAWQIINLSWPILIDKTTLASAYIYLNKAINPMGQNAIASYKVIQDLERFTILPAIAFATVITFLISNRLGANDPEGARSNIRKTLYMGGAMVATLLLILCIHPIFFTRIFDLNGDFSAFTAKVFPFISLLVVFDFIQLILSGVLRGAGDVKAVMIIRVIGCYAFFYPLISFLSTLTYPSDTVKFICLYGSFYVHTGFLGLLLILRLKWSRLKTNKI